MNLLKTVIDDLDKILKNNGIDEVIDIRISNLDNYDYQINNLVKHQNHPKVNSIKEEISKSLNLSGIVDVFEVSQDYLFDSHNYQDLICGYR